MLEVYRVYLIILSQLRNSVDVIIHSAWRLDFNLSLSSFDSSVRATQNLINFAHDAVNVSRLKFIFTSSVASAVSWNSSQGPYPEETILDARFAVGNGYGESKYVSERVFVLYFAMFYFWLIGSSLSSSFLKLALTHAP